MNTTTALQPLISAPARIAGVLAALAIVATGVSFAGHASEEAVGTAQAALHPTVTYVRLQPVEVVGHRLASDTMADAACAAPQTRI
jgi:hypothetical protein